MATITNVSNQQPDAIWNCFNPIFGKYFTHLEYEEAERLNLLMLIYLIDEDKQKILPKNIDTGVVGEKLKNLKSKILKKRTIYFYITPQVLAKTIFNGLT